MPSIDAIAESRTDRSAEAIRAHFRSDHYSRINQRRLEHLATLDLIRPGTRVLELGAGIGDLTTFFLDRGCTVTLVEGRPDNLAICRERFAEDPRVAIHRMDLDAPRPLASPDESWDLVFAYGLLYHLRHPAEAIHWMAQRTASILLLETCVGLDTAGAINPIEEDAAFASQALHGLGCRPTRSWVLEHLSAAMPHAYCARTQPNHDEFPTNWRAPEPSATGLYRAVFAASRASLDHHPALTRCLPDHQARSA